MQPLTIVTGILLGSCVAITLGLAVVLFLYLIVGADQPSIQREFGPLGASLALFTGMTVLAAAAFYGTLKEKAWKWPALLALLTGVVLTGFYYWP